MPSASADFRDVGLTGDCDGSKSPAAMAGKRRWRGTRRAIERVGRTALLVGALQSHALADTSRLGPEWDLDSQIEEEEVLTTEELHDYFRDLVAGPLPTEFHVAVLLGARSPYYFLGMSVDADYLPVPWLRLGGTVGMGATAAAGAPKAFAAHLMEAWLGLRALGVSSQRRVEVPHYLGRAPRKVPLQARIPSYHGLYVEGGITNGVYGAYRCVDSCDGQNMDRELEEERHRLWGYGVGLRYLYQRHADSKHFDGSVFRTIDVAAHYFFRPIAAPTTALYDASGAPISGFDSGFPLCKKGCMQLTLGGGISPARWLPFLDFGVGFHYWSPPRP